MATHFYFNGHTYEIETAPLSWAAADSNATALAWDDDGAFGITVTSYLANIGSAAENAAILKNVKSSVPIGASANAEGADQVWIGMANSALDRSGQLQTLSGNGLLWSVIEWDGLIGTAGADNLIGTSNADTIDGNAGNDSIKAGEGDNIVYMGDGNDRVTTGNGNNSIFAETTNTDSDDGNDTVTTGNGADFIAPGTGDDVVKAGNGNNTVIGGSGNDKITTGSGDDTINTDGYYAEDGVGGEGDDTISTGAGNDYIVAGKGNDIVKAGDGNDHIVLGDGFDTVWGGNGNDIFEFDTLPTNSANSASSTTTSASANSNGGLNFSTGAAGSSGGSGGIAMTTGGTSSSSNAATVTTIKDFNAGKNGSVVDQLVLDSSVFEAFSTDLLPDGLTATNFLKGKGLTGPSSNETGVDDYLIFDTGSGRLYYDADGNQSESETILIAVLKGNLTDFNIEDIGIM